MKSDRRKKGFIAACVLPATILFIIFMLIPTFNVFRISLNEQTAFTPKSTFVGLENFVKLFHDAKGALRCKCRLLVK